MSHFLERPPLRGAGWLWFAALATALGVDWWVRLRWGAQSGVTTAEVCLPPVLLLFLLFHPRPRGLSDFGSESPRRALLHLTMAPEAEAGERHRAQAARLLRGRLGPLWLRCGVAGFIAAGWLRRMGWLVPDWIATNAMQPPDLAQLSWEVTPLAAAACACFFASHATVWERTTLAGRPPSRLEAFSAFVGSALRALASQALAAAASFAFVMLTLLIVGFLTVGVLALRHFDLPAWFPDLAQSHGPHVVAFYTVLPGMLAQALRDVRGLNGDVAMRIALLARELLRERTGTAGKSASMGRLTGDRASRPAS